MKQFTPEWENLDKVWALDEPNEREVRLTDRRFCQTEKREFVKALVNKR